MPRPEEEVFPAAFADNSVLFTASMEESIKGDSNNGVIHISGTI
jgi:hypothetical protein